METFNIFLFLGFFLNLIISLIITNQTRHKDLSFTANLFIGIFLGFFVQAIIIMVSKDKLKEDSREDYSDRQNAKTFLRLLIVLISFSIGLFYFSKISIENKNQMFNFFTKK
jgi:hypothetical protein